MNKQIKITEMNARGTHLETFWVALMVSTPRALNVEYECLIIDLELPISFI